MKRVAIDSNVVDHIADTPGFLEAIQQAHRGGRLVIVSSHVVRDELAQAPHSRRALLLATYEALPREDVPTMGAVFGVSRYGMATFGDGSESGIRLDQVKGGGDYRMRDALIGTTAAGGAEAFVTCERDFPGRMRRAGTGCELWSVSDLKSYVGLPEL